MVLYYILVPLAWLVWHIGFRIRVEGRENLKKVQTKGYILAPTHVSAIDPVFIVVTRWGRRMVVFAKKELFEINAFLTWFFRCCGGVCVRGTKDEMAVITQTVEACKQGRTLLIFPEHPRKGGQTAAPQERSFCHCRRSRGGRCALPHLLRHPGRKNAPVLQGAGDLRRADARSTVCHGKPPGHQKTPCQQAGIAGSMGKDGSVKNGDPFG